MAALLWLTTVGQAISLQEAEQAINALPVKVAADRAKKAMLEFTLERARASAPTKMEEEQKALLNDIKAGLTVPASAMAAISLTDQQRIPALRPVAEMRGNPYLIALNQWGKKHLEKPEAPWPRATAGTVVMPGLKTREAGEELRRYLWLYVNPASEWRGEPELLKRVLRRAAAFVDAALLNARPDTKVRTEIYDQFATEEGFSGVIELMQAFPQLLPPHQRKHWESGLRVAFDEIWGQMKRANNWNLNIETARMVAVLHFGYYYRKPEVVAKVLHHAEVTLTKMRPDGGFPYNGDSNPSCNYHGALIQSLTKIYALSQHQPILKGLVATQWKGPVMGRTDEFWTSPFHKSYRWNFSSGTEWGNALVLSMSKNPYMAGLVRGTYPPDRDAVAWYRKGIVSRPLPDRYTIVDRNIDGPRGWYGRFTYAATMHSKHARDRTTGGHETLMGCMTVDEPDGRVNSILVNVTPRVRIDRFDTKDARGTIQSTAWAQLSSDLKSAYVTGKHHSASSARYALTTIKGGAYQGKVSDWESRQVWLGTSDRIVGLLSTVATKEDAAAAEINAVMRFISGGTAGAAVCKTLEKVKEHHYRYGELELIIHHSNYATITMDVLPYRLPKYPASELTLRAYPKDHANVVKHHAGKALYCVIEARPVWAKGEATVAMSAVNDLLSLRVRIQEREWQLFLNASPKDREVTPHYPQNPEHVSVRLSHHTAGAPQRPSAATLRLAPDQQLLVVSSSDPIDHQPGWSSFATMVGAE